MAEARDSSALSDLGVRLSRHTLLYGIGSGVTLVISFVNLAVLTRFLDPAEFGRLGLLLVFAALLTVLYNLGTLQGTLMRVFGAAGEEEVAEEGAPDAADPRATLGTGLFLTTFVVVAGTAATLVAAGPIADLLLGDRSATSEVMLASVSGGLGAIWRLMTNVTRLERRAVTFLTLSWTRPTLVLALSVTLVAAGNGVPGAIGGVAGGTALALLATLLATRRSFRVTFRASEAPQILRRGAPFIAIIAAFSIVQQADLFVVSRYVPDEDVGLYRLASRVGSLVSYATAGFLMASMPLRLTSLYAAAEREHGAASLRGTLLTYFVVFVAGLLVLVGVTADLLVRIAPGSYSEAAPLVPLLAAAFGAAALFTATYRAARFRWRRLTYVMSALLTAAVFVPASLVLVPWLGAPGAAVASIAGFLLATLVIGLRSQLGDDPIPLSYGPLALTVVSAAALIAASRLAGDRIEAPLLGLLLLCAFPVIVVVSRVVPPGHLKELGYIIRAVFLRGNIERASAAVTQLAPIERAALDLALVHRCSPSQIADWAGTTPENVHRHLVMALRQINGIGLPSADDERIGALLFDSLAVAERDSMARALFADGVPPAEVYALEGTLELLRRAASPKWWRRRRRPLDGVLEPPAGSGPQS